MTKSFQSADRIIRRDRTRRIVELDSEMAAKPADGQPTCYSSAASPACFDTERSSFPAGKKRSEIWRVET
jgi:hypothetical protein